MNRMEKLVRDAIKDGRTDVQKVARGVYAVPVEIVDPYLRTSCAQCGATLATCLTCSACGDIRYCGKACQTANWKSIHKLYCKRHKELSVGKLCWENLFGAKNFAQVTTTMREHEGLGQLIETAMGEVLLKQQHLVQNAKLNDIKSMARVTSRRLNRKDPSCDQAAGLMTIAAAMSTIATPDVDEALASTPLFRCVARFYLHYAPKLAQAAAASSLKSSVGKSSKSSDQLEYSSPEAPEAFDIPLLSAMVNLVHPNAPSTQDLLTRCVDTTWEAIEGCAAVLAEEQEQQQQQQQQQQASSTTETETDAAGAAADTKRAAETEGEETKRAADPPNNPNKTTKTNNKECNKNTPKKSKQKSANNNKKNDKDKDNDDAINEEKNHLIDGILPNLRMLARNLAYIGARPTPQMAFRMPRIVVADFCYSIRNMDHEAIQVWATTAQNMVEITAKYPLESEINVKNNNKNKRNKKNNKKAAATNNEQDNNNNNAAPATNNDNDNDNDPIPMHEIGNAIFNVLQVCAPSKLGGMDIVFRNEKPPPGEEFWGIEERK